MPFLLLGTKALDGGSHDQVRIEDAGEGHPYGGNSLDNLGVSRSRQAQAAIVGVDHGAKQAKRFHLLDIVMGIFIRMFQAQDMGSHVLFKKAVDTVEDQSFFLAGILAGSILRFIQGWNPPYWVHADMLFWCLRIGLRDRFASFVHTNLTSKAGLVNK